MKQNQKGFTLVEILVVIAILAILAGAVFFALNPTQMFRDARNTRRRQDVDAVAAAVRQYVLRNLQGDPALISDPANCDLAALPVMDPVGGVDATEGGPLSDLSTCLSDYMAVMPTAPGSSVYRWGVDDATSPTHVYVGVDSMEEVDGDTPDDYYLVY